MRLAIDADEAALELKALLVAHLRSKGLSTLSDLDLLGKSKVDYPDIALHLASRLAQGEFDRGILLCGTGLGMAMVANKVEGIWAGVCHDTFSAERLKKSNNANVLTMGARVIGPELAKMIVDAWLGSEFAGGGSTPKVERMRQIEHQLFHSTLPTP